MTPAQISDEPKDPEDMCPDCKHEWSWHSMQIGCIKLDCKCEKTPPETTPALPQQEEPAKHVRYGAHFYLEFTVGNTESAAEEAEIIAKSHGGDSYVNIETLLPAEEPDVPSGHAF